MSRGNSRGRSNPDLTGEVEYGTDQYGGEIKNHGGYFSGDNPYFRQAGDAKKRQDRDALYERAVDWEANQQALWEQRNYDRALVDEQRQYDSPLARLQRERQAGINSDIVGGSTGGSTGGSSSQPFNSTVMSPVDGDTKFSNIYDNANLTLDSINTAIRVIGTFTQFGSAVVNAIDTVKTLSPRKEILEQQARGLQISNDVAEATKGDKIAQIQNQSQASELANEVATEQLDAMRMANFSSKMDTVHQLANWFTKDMLSQDGGPEALERMMTYMGIDGDEFETYAQMIDDYHNNPMMRALMSSARTGANRNEAYEEINTPQVFRQLLGKELQIQQFQKDAQILYAAMDATFAEILYDSGYIDEVAANEIFSQTVTADTLRTALSNNETLRMQNGFTQEDLKYASKKLAYDAEVFAKSVFNVKAEIDKNYDLIGKIYSEAIDGQLTDAQSAMVRAYQSNIIALEALGANMMNEVYNIANRRDIQQYSSSFMVDDNGQITNLYGKGNEISFSRFTFQNIMNGDYTQQQLTQDYIGMGLDFIKSLFPKGKSSAPATK